ncbi:uncharacterized protein DS421_2g52580 [Arachis hypogaea]|nr:uncharacterized protein DS421_2g52580 [Arachis hypogaea]
MHLTSLLFDRANLTPCFLLFSTLLSALLRLCNSQKLFSASFLVLVILGF